MTEPVPHRPSVDPARIDQLYSELAAMQVELDPDPLALGPKRINNKIAECRRFLSLTERMFVSVSQDLHWFRREHRRAQADFELQVQDLYANDPQTRSGPNVVDRQAIAHTKLRKEREEINRLQFSVEDLEAVQKIISAKRNDLKDISSRLRDQLKVCQEEIGLGNRWGNHHPPARGSSSPIVDKAGEEVLSLMDDVLAGMESESETPEVPEEGTLEPAKERPVDTVENVDEVLSAIGTSTSQASRVLPPANKDVDLDALLEGFEEHLPKPIEVKTTSDKMLDEILGDLG